MFISTLIATLQEIQNEYGDIIVEMYHDKRHNDNAILDDPIEIDDIKLVKLKGDSKSVYLSNEFAYYEVFDDCICTATYNPETKKYIGKVEPPERLEGVNLSFETDDKFSLEKLFEYTIHEYYDFLGNAKLTQTYQVVNQIAPSDEEDDEDDEEADFDYGDIEDDNQED